MTRFVVPTSCSRAPVLSSVMTLGRTFAGPLSGYLAVRMGWQEFFAVSALFGVPGLLMLFLSGQSR